MISWGSRRDYREILNQTLKQQDTHKSAQKALKTLVVLQFSESLRRSVEIENFRGEPNFTTSY